MEHVTHGITLHGIARFVDIATDALSTAREEIDALNVYPVPDGDTGTNMFLTVSAARDGLREAMAADPGIELAEAMTVLARGALLGARGNSGVILSQMLRAFVRHLAAATAEDRRADVMATAMPRRPMRATPRWARPVEGTILTVARAASDAALEAAREPSARARTILSAAAAAARLALARTPEQLPVLAAGRCGRRGWSRPVRRPRCRRDRSRPGVVLAVRRSDRHPPHPGGRRRPTT